MKVLLVGLGRMGQRYVRVLNELYGSKALIYAVDPQQADIKGVTKVVSSLSEISDRDFELGIDAHPNQGRLEVLKHFIDLNIKKVVIEKPLASSWKEASAIESISKKSGLEILSPFYHRYSDHFSSSILNKLDAGTLQTVNISGGALGIGCNGIHYVDLCNFFFGAKPISIFSNLDLNSVASPRGEQFTDHGGLIVLNYLKGRASIDLCSKSSVGLCIHLVYEHGRIVIHDQAEPQWFWFKQPEKMKGQPLYRTSNETQLIPPLAFGTTTEVLMKSALSAFLSAKKCPGLAEAVDALKILGLAMASSDLKRVVTWNDDQLLEAATFSFT